jgi:hypothetical protein
MFVLEGKRPFTVADSQQFDAIAQLNTDQKNSSADAQRDHVSHLPRSMRFDNPPIF